MRPHSIMRAQDLGSIKNTLGILSEDRKSLRPQALFSATKLRGTEVARILGVQLPMLYRKTLPLKPASKLEKRIISLVIATDIVFELLGNNIEESRRWLMLPNTILFGDSPFEVIMRGEGDQIISWLSERTGQKAAAAF